MKKTDTRTVLATLSMLGIALLSLRLIVGLIRGEEFGSMAAALMFLGATLIVLSDYAPRRTEKLNVLKRSYVPTLKYK